MAANFKLHSAAFTAGAAIPRMYSCEGDGTSPPLAWTDPPEGTQTLALVVDDPDAPGEAFVHWVLFNLPPDRRGLPEALDVSAHFGEGTPPVQGVNNFGDLGYGPPCPPPGDDPHHYSFRLYALDAPLDLGEGVTKRQLTQTMDGHILAEADLMGTYQRGA